MTLKKWKIWKKHMILLFCSGGLLVCGCGLLPEEQTGGNVALVHAVETVEYELAEVTREDVALTKTLYCAYLQMKEEVYGFQSSGRPVQYVYVKVGDVVKEGDLLAKLETGELESEIEDVCYQIEKNKLLLKQAEEMREFELAEIQKQYNRGKLTKAEYDNARKDIGTEYQQLMDQYSDTIYIEELRRKKMEEEYEGCLIYAKMDGMVSFLRGKLQDSYPKEGAEIVKVIDNSQCAFRMDEPEYAEYFAAGEEFILTNNNGTTYETVVMDRKDAAEEKCIYFALKEPDATLAVGTKAYITITLEERKNVLALPVLVLHHAGGKTYVYCEDESGLKSVRYIKTGLIGTKYAEIVEGLAEGEIVIKK